MPRKEQKNHKKEDNENQNIKKEQLENYFKNQEEDHQSRFVKNFIEDFQKSESKAPLEQSRQNDEHKNNLNQKKINIDLLNQLDGMVSQNNKRVN